MKNFDKFIERGAKLLAALYENFPVPIDVNFPLQPDDNSDDALLSHDVAGCTVLWLLDEGYIRGDEESCSFSRVRLTKKGLVFLQNRCGTGDLTGEDFQKAMRYFVQ
jgi:hypothetical protein